jgi:hypothetical protein
MAEAITDRKKEESKLTVQYCECCEKETEHEGRWGKQTDGYDIYFTECQFCGNIETDV